MLFCAVWNIVVSESQALEPCIEMVLHAPTHLNSYKNVTRSKSRAKGTKKFGVPGSQSISVMVLLDPFVWICCMCALLGSTQNPANSVILQMLWLVRFSASRARYSCFWFSFINERPAGVLSRRHLAVPRSANSFNHFIQITVLNRRSTFVCLDAGVWLKISRHTK